MQQTIMLMKSNESHFPVTTSSCAPRPLECGHVTFLSQWIKHIYIGTCPHEILLRHQVKKPI